MKKAYIIPNARVITLYEEHELMNTQSLDKMNIDPDEGNAVQQVTDVWSNKRRNSIWGDE